MRVDMVLFAVKHVTARIEHHAIMLMVPVFVMNYSQGGDVKHVHVHTHTRAHIHIHVHVHTHTHIYTSVFDKLIWRTIGPKSFLFGTAQFSLWARWCS